MHPLSRSVPPHYLDPQGYYARLGLDAEATQEAITNAFRQRALRLHPDVPGTGDEAAFLALRAAYDVLSNPERRLAYDHAAHTPAPEPPPAPFTATHGAHDFRPDVAEAAWVDDETIGIPPGFTQRPPPLPREWSSLPYIQMGAAAGVALLLCIGIIGAVTSFRSAQPPAATTVRIAATAPTVLPPSAEAQRATRSGLAPVRLPGLPNYYVLPAASPTMLWRQ